MPHSLSENFSCSDSEMNSVDVPEVSKDLESDHKTLDEVSSIHSHKMDLTSESSIEEPISESFSEDSVRCNLHNTLDSQSETAEDKQIVNTSADSEESSEYEIVSLNVNNLSDPTVMNTTCNLITQSADKKDLVQYVQTSPYKLSNGVDKSRVVVQVLTSNNENCIEKQTMVENKCNLEDNSKMFSFRDDVFTMLSKSKPPNDKGSNNEDISNCEHITNMCSPHDCTLKVLPDTKPNCDSYKNGCVKTNAVKDNHDQPSNVSRFQDDVHKVLSKTNTAVCNDVKSVETPKYEASKQFERKRRRKNVKFFFHNGRGTILSEIKFVASNLKNASTRLLRILHYVLFGTYGVCSTGSQLLQTKKNILQFCGYPFKRNSENFSKKKNCLVRLPFPILLEIHKSLIENKDYSSRKEMVDHLMEFFMEPKSEEERRMSERNCLKNMAEEDYTHMKGIAVNDGVPCVLVEKLTKEDIKRLQKEIKTGNGVKKKRTGSKTEAPTDCLPAYILKGPGTKLKHFPKTVKRVLAAKDQMIEILHYILYGRVESTKICRRNILEFSGFLSCQQKFIDERKAMLNNMNSVELLELSNILCLHCKTNTVDRRMQKILSYLSAPCNPVKYMRRHKAYCYKVATANIVPEPPSEQCNKPCLSEKKETVIGSKLRDFENSLPEKKVTVLGPKLRDFENIRSIIEFASPSDLRELNDLLFITPSGESEIHQKILEFSRFDFLNDSIEYHYRKTLMQYMSFGMIRRIAQLLDLENWEKVSSQEDLSANILNFLMELKLPDKKSQKRKVSKPVLVDTVVDKMEPVVERDEPISEELRSDKKSRVVRIIEQKTERWCFQKSVQNKESSLDHQYSLQKSPLSNQSVTQAKRCVVIHRLTKSTLQPQEIAKINHSPKQFMRSLEDSLPLRTFLHHPSDTELRQIITNVIKSDLFEDLTMEKLVMKVYGCYPDYNLSYREAFIKNAARQVLLQLRSNAVDTINSMQLQMSDVI